MGIGAGLFDRSDVALEITFIERRNVLGDLNAPIGNQRLDDIEPTLPGLGQFGFRIVFGRQQLRELRQLGRQLGILLMGPEPDRDNPGRLFSRLLPLFSLLDRLLGGLQTQLDSCLVVTGGI